MGGYGWHNPWPFEWGGGETRIEREHRALRSVMGDDEARALGPKDGLEDASFKADATVIAMCRAAIERAGAQAFPDTATDHLDAWEARLGIESEATDVARRIAIAERENAKVRADVPHLAQAISEMSPFLTLYLTPRESARLSMLGPFVDPTGSTFGPGSPPASPWAGFSDHYVYRVVWDHVASGLAYPDEALRRRLSRYLNDTLPSHIYWTLQQAPGTVFYLDGGPDGTSLLDATPIGS